MAIDPFGKSMFGGQSSLVGQVPGTTAAASTSSVVAPKPAAYKYAGQGWNDPLAQQMYTKYAFGGRGDPSTAGKLADMANRQKAVGMEHMNYNTPIDPTTWGGSYRGTEVDKMKAAYLAAGGQGTYDQLAATNPSSVGWPTDSSGNALPKMDMGTGKTLYPSGTQGFQPAAPGSVQAMGGSGSSNALVPEILKKMWR